MIKKFEDLTLQDDFMFCKVMQNPDLCKRLIEMILSDTIGKITYISIQHNLKNYEQAKSVRFDVLVQTENGKFYDIEMQVSNERNIPKRRFRRFVDKRFIQFGKLNGNVQAACCGVHAVHNCRAEVRFYVFISCVCVNHNFILHSVNYFFSYFIRKSLAAFLFRSVFRFFRNAFGNCNRA